MSQQELTEKTAGVVEAVSDKESKPYYNIHINGQWFNGSESTDISEGDKVELEISNDEDEFIDIVDKTILEESGGKEERGTSKSAQEREKTGDKPSTTSSNSFTSKSRDISIKVALKTAAEHASTRPSDDQAKHLDEVNELANGYLNIMEGLKKGENQK